MTATHRKKNSRARGGWTHGWGAKKKHRGAGHRGGRGNAGSGKRGDCKKPTFWKGGQYFGKKGFTSHTKEAVAITLRQLDEKAEMMFAKELIAKEGDIYIVDSVKAGFDKLIGTGKVTKKFKVTVAEATERAVKKIEEKGGEVITESKDL